MSAVVLESEEFAYLLSVVHAVSVPGIKDSALFPSDPQSREKTYAKGLQLMKEHGWIKPTEKPSQFHFNDTLCLMAAVIANPEFVLFTIRTNKSSARQVITHYMAGSDIVELVSTEDKKFHLGIVPDKAILFERLESVLGLQTEKQNLKIQFSTGQQTIKEVKNLAVKGQHQKAANILGNMGLGGLSVDSLLEALTANQTSELDVFKIEKGQITAGKNAKLLQGKNITWLIKRLDTDPATISAETIQADTLSNTFNSFVRFLSQSQENR
jgi:hypothetical protein